MFARVGASSSGSLSSSSVVFYILVGMPFLNRLHENFSLVQSSISFLNEISEHHAELTIVCTPVRSSRQVNSDVVCW